MVPVSSDRPRPHSMTLMVSLSPGFKQMRCLHCCPLIDLLWDQDQEYLVEIFSQPIQTATWMPLLSHWLTVSLTHLHCDIKITGWAGIFKNICTIYVIEVYICAMDSYSWYYSRSMRLITHFCSQKFWTNSAFFNLQREHARKSVISLKKSRIT